MGWSDIAGFIFCLGGLNPLCWKSACMVPREPPEEEEYDRCGRCHTSPDEESPSSFHLFWKEKKDAHIFHLNKIVTNPIHCKECHPLPDKEKIKKGEEDLYEHIDIKTIVSLGEGGLYDPNEKSCAVYCHGNTKMYWDVEYDKPQFTCKSCHTPTEPPHDISDLKECYKCHDSTMTADGTFASKGVHINGQVEKVEDTCNVCHEQPPQSHKIKDYSCSDCHVEPSSPFKTSESDTHKDDSVTFKENLCSSSCHDYDPPTSGAHKSHIEATVMSGVTCVTCHNKIPSIMEGIFEHLGAWPVVDFSNLASPSYLGSSKPDYDETLKQCLNIYCHGAGLPDGQKVNPLKWDDPSGTAKACGACHGIPPPPQLTIHDPEDIACYSCHPSDKHIDGAVDIK